jgi:hypothetical protein
MEIQDKKEEGLQVAILMFYCGVDRAGLEEMEDDGQQMKVG